MTADGTSTYAWNARDQLTDIKQGEVTRVDVLFTNFISTLNQRPEVFPFLPVVQLQPMRIATWISTKAR